MFSTYKQRYPIKYVTIHQMTIHWVCINFQAHKVILNGRFIYTLQHFKNMTMRYWGNIMIYIFGAWRYHGPFLDIRSNCDLEFDLDFDLYLAMIQSYIKPSATHLYIIDSILIGVWSWKMWARSWRNCWPLGSPHVIWGVFKAMLVHHLELDPVTLALTFQGHILKCKI